MHNKQLIFKPRILLSLPISFHKKHFLSCQHRKKGEIKAVWKLVLTDVFLFFFFYFELSIIWSEEAGTLSVNVLVLRQSQEGLKKQKIIEGGLQVNSFLSNETVSKTV